MTWFTQSTNISKGKYKTSKPSSTESSRLAKIGRKFKISSINNSMSLHYEISRQTSVKTSRHSKYFEISLSWKQHQNRPQHCSISAFARWKLPSFAVENWPSKNMKRLHGPSRLLCVLGKSVMMNWHKIAFYVKHELRSICSSYPKTAKKVNRCN